MRVVIHIEPDQGDAGHYGVDSFEFRNDETEYEQALLALFTVVRWNVRKLMRDPYHKITTPPWMTHS